MDIKRLLKELTDEEKIALVSGRNFFSTNSVKRLDIPALDMADGPHGVRKQLGASDNGCSTSEPAVCFPTAATVACSWDEGLIYKMGRAMASEARHYGVSVLLGPGVNIKRNPLCGRNFEYYSEDPYLAGTLGSAIIKGIQDGGVSACVKHFALNNSENFRFMGDSIADERTMRDIYLRPFEMAVRDAGVDCVMSAYNKVLGSYCSENKVLLDDILRGEWGFDGVCMTDWGGIHDRRDALLSTTDLEMPGDTAHCRARLYESLSGDGVREALDASVRRILTLIDKHSGKQRTECDLEGDARLAERIAESSAVLLKNDGALPLDRDKPLAVIGDLFYEMRYQGSGSSMINATEVISPKRAFDMLGIDYRFARGYDEDETEDEDALLAEALSLAETAESVLLFIGLTDYSESEAGDREHMRLPDGQLKLIDRLQALGKKIIAVSFGGSPFEVPFIDGLSALLHMYLPGQSGGMAAARLIFGDANPSGKLSETWPKEYSCVPFHDKYSKMPIEVYKESVFIGYRYYLEHKDDVRFPFGFGLSYSSFEYSELQVLNEDGRYTVRVKVTNTSGVDGEDTVQLYIASPNKLVYGPKYELIAFTKVKVKAGDCIIAELSFDQSELGYYDIKKKRRVREGGEYTLMVGASALDIRLTRKIDILGDTDKSPYSPEVMTAYRDFSGDNITDELFEEMSGIAVPDGTEPLPLTMESRFCDLKRTFLGRIIYRTVMYFMCTRLEKQAERLPEGPERDNRLKGARFLRRIMDSNSIGTLCTCSSGTLSLNVAEGILNIANGKIFRGICRMMGGHKAPPLPDKD
ncbi:MAG: glycoside hydrolase family 3 C-terminal domain-containing protein [Clostridia bacterium]|nr:glycoside hydrolase family 3 C-terminal domain-containing protein [Clostridia bacterium]